MARFLSVFIFALLPFVCFPQQATLVKDINTDLTYNCPFTNLIDLNGLIIMTGADTINGSELWRSDGTDQGTYLLKDIFAGPSSSGPGNFLKTDSLIFFLAQDSNRTFLCRTNGTAPGTLKIKEFSQGITYLNSSCNGIAYIILFVYNPIKGKNEEKLWRSDGTSVGTFELSLPFEENGLSYLTPGDNDMFFYQGSTLCKTDGTLSGTDSITTAFFAHTEYYKSNLYFIKNSKELWKTDGTITNTKKITSKVDVLTIGKDNGNELFFVATPAGLSNHGLWKTDGTDSGTVKIKDLHSVGTNTSFFKGPGSYVYFITSDSIGIKELWRSDGTSLGTIKICDYESNYPWKTAVLGGKFIFSNKTSGTGHELWSTDGTMAGTGIVKDLNFGIGDFQYNFQNIAVSGNEIFFPGTEGGAMGYSLWKSDGTALGTIKVKSQFVANGNSNIENITSFNDKVYFSINSELWCSDGTSTGSIKVKSFQVGSKLSIFTTAPDFFTFALFNNSDTTYLYRSDGTQAGTFEIGSYDSRSICSNRPVGCWKECGIRESVHWNGNIYFPAMVNNQGWSLYRTDGTKAGTINFLNLNFPREITPLKDYFTFVSANKLWRSDGTVNGTYEISSTVSPISLTPAGNDLYFLGNDQTHGLELWKTDGTMNGTHLIKDALPGIAGPFYYCCAPDSYINKFLWNSSGKIYFFGNDNHGNEPWISDGTENGTRMLKDIRHGAISSGGSGYPGTGDYIGLEGKTIFVAIDSSHGTELWETDGTEVGTMMIKDITPNQNFTNVYFNGPRILFACDTAVIFTADDGIHGSEPWIYFPSSGDIHLIQDISPGNRSSGIDEVTYCGQFLYFKAYDGVHGGELWKMSFPFPLNVSENKDIVTLNVVGNNNSIKNKPTLYPNPGQGNYIFSFPENTLVNDISILNNLGVSVKKYLVNAPSTELQIDISGLSPGVYLLEYSVKEEKDCIKIVKY